MATWQKPQFGWLVMGLLFGLLVGHYIAYAWVIPPGYGFRFGDSLLSILLACSICGIFVGAILERPLRRVSIEYASVVLVVISLAYFFLYGFPIMNASRE
jgi:hypothetical protein